MEGSTPAARVSVCTSVLNQSDGLRRMIASVVAQTFAGWELLIVDDGSTEDIKAVVESFNDKRIRYWRFDENRGIPHGSNFALKVAVGEFVSLLSTDEVIAPEKMAQQLAYLDEHPKVDCVWGLPGKADEPMGERPEWEQYALGAHNRSREHWLRNLLQLEGVPIGGASLLMRRKAMESLGWLDEKLTIFSDHELYCRFFEKHTGVVLPYRWAVDKGQPAGVKTVRETNLHKAQEEYEYVRAKHPLPTPSATGRVTVGIPCYNMAKYLPEAVASVLAQTVTDFDVLIVDDGSTDDFKEVVAQFSDPRIRIMAMPENSGREAVTNLMAATVETPFLALLAADDTLAPDFLAKCYAKFAENPWLEFVASQTDLCDADMKPLPQTADTAQLLAIPKPVNRDRAEWLRQLYGGNHYFGAGMYRTSAILEVGGWEKEYKVISDYQMYLKLLQRENIGIIEEDLTHTRITGANDSLLSKERAEELPWLYHDARKRFYRKLMKVVIATPFYELKGFSPYISSLVQTVRLLAAYGIHWQFMELSGDSYVHRARNTMCDNFLRDPDATDLFFIDSDMSWNPDAFVKMCMLPEDIVGGSYPVKNAWEAWTSIPKMHEEDGAMRYKGRELGDGTALIEAQVLAGGFLRIKRGALERFKEHYPDLWYTEPSTDPANPEHKFTAFFAAQSEDHRFYGEDHMFSKRVREMGCNMFIYPNVDMHHFGVKGFDGNLDKFLKKKALTDALRPAFPDAPPPAAAVEHKLPVLRS